MNSSLAQTLARPEILAMEAYQSARSLALQGRIFLDANESPYCSPLSTGQGQHPLFSHFNLYPDPSPQALYQKFAEIYGVDADKLSIGRGADEAIDLLVRAFCRPYLDSILICPPTYGVYKIAATTQGCKTLEAPLNSHDFRINLEAIHHHLDVNTKIVFLCSPNNPTGNIIPLDDLINLSQSLSNRALLVVDEAYIEFSNHPSMIRHLDHCENLVILRTLSKAYGLAGLRVGCAIANRGIISILNRIRAPYPLSRPVVSIAIDLLQDSGLKWVRDNIAEINLNRIWFAGQIDQHPIVEKTYPSEGNFILVKFKPRKNPFDRCKQQGIILRNMSDKPGLADCVRISIGTKEQLNHVLNVLDDWRQNSFA